MNQFLLMCTDSTRNTRDLLSKLKSSDKWTLTLDAGNTPLVSPCASFRINSALSREEIEKELFIMFQENLFMVSSAL